MGSYDECKGYPVYIKNNYVENGHVGRGYGRNAPLHECPSRNAPTA